MITINKNWQGIGRIPQTTMKQFIEAVHTAEGLQTIGEFVNKGGAMKQEKLIRRSPQEIAELRQTQSAKLSEYIKIEAEKTAADSDYNERLNDLWDEIKGIQTRINEG